MTTRQELLSQWQQRLTEAERSRGDLTWSDRLRKRLYRFLLAMYGRTTWPGAADDVDNSRGRARHSELHVAEAQEAEMLGGTAGKAPRSRAQILAGLKHVQGLSDELAPPGPLQERLPEDAWVVVYSSPKRKRGSLAYRTLRSAGLQPKLLRQGATSQIQVARSQAAQAMKVLASRPKNPTHHLGLRPSIYRILFFTLELLAAVGAAISVVVAFVLFNRNNALVRSNAESFATSAAAIGSGMLMLVVALLRVWLRTPPSRQSDQPPKK